MRSLHQKTFFQGWILAENVFRGKKRFLAANFASGQKKGG